MNNFLVYPDVKFCRRRFFLCRYIWRTPARFFLMFSCRGFFIWLTVNKLNASFCVARQCLCLQVARRQPKSRQSSFKHPYWKFVFNAYTGCLSDFPVVIRINNWRHAFSVLIQSRWFLPPTEGKNFANSEKVRERKRNDWKSSISVNDRIWATFWTFEETNTNNM